MESQTRTRKLRRSRLTVIGLRQSLIYQPLAVLMSILVAPAVSWIEGGGGGARPSQAQAQITLGNCNSAGTTVIQKYCVNGNIYLTDLPQLESDAVNAYLGMHHLSPTDAHVVYDYGRSDLRSAIRGDILTTLFGIAQKPASQRTPHEQSVYQWIQALVQNNEIALYSNAVSQFRLWQADPCKFTLDPTIASAYGLTYDGTPFCFNTQFNTLLSTPTAPAESYFRAYGYSKSYAAPAAQYPELAKLAEATAMNVGLVLGVAGAGAAVVLGTASALLVASLSAALAAGTGAAAAAITGASFVVSGFTVSALGVAGLAAGPLAIILIAIAIGVVAGMEAYQNQQTIDNLNNMNTTLTQVTNTPPDLNTFISDTSGLGMEKLQLTFNAQTVPERPSTAALPAHQPTDLSFVIQPSGGSPTTSTTLGYRDWDGNMWSAQTWGGWFVQTCANGTGPNKCSQKDSIIADLQYVDWSGVKWTASRVGSTFISVKSQPASTDAKCPANSAGVSPVTDFSTCSSYVSTSIPMTDNTGNFVRVSMAVLGAPVFTPPTYLSFGPNVASTRTITTTGNPNPTVCLQSSTLTADFTLNGGNKCSQNGTFTVAFNGDSSAPTSTYQLVLTASNTAATTTQTFTISVSPQLGIISPDTLTGAYGVPVNFLVVTTGNPPPTLSIDPRWTQFPNSGLTFTDNKNGTATISGTPNVSSINFCVASSTCGIVAQNSQGTVEQHFTINIAGPPQASIVPPIGATFHAGSLNQVVLLSAGARTQVSWQMLANPPWLNLQDNGNGTATLSGTPPLGTSGTFTPQIFAFTVGNLLGFTTAYPVTVPNTPVFTSPNSANFTVGTNSGFGISANSGTISLVNILPKGLQFSQGGSLSCLFLPACIAGSAIPGTGGQYDLTLTATSSTGSTQQSLLLNVYEAPQITSNNSATMFVGMPAAFVVTTLGFPSVSKHPLPPNPQPPTSPNQGDGMFFTVSGLPSSLRFSNLNPQGFATGTLTIQGTPADGDAGFHHVVITAQNGVGTTAQQTLSLDIVKITGPAPASSTTCNGNYTGTFNGSVTVSAGQNCAFYGGGISGNVSVNGGHLALNHANVTGNMTIQGGAGFSITGGTSIGGNLSIQSVASGSTASQMCQATVSGNLEISGNAIPIQIGNPQNSCFGSSFGKNVDISGNTASVTVYNNTVGKTLSCSGNTSITGGDNKAQQKGGQCAGF